MTNDHWAHEDGELGFDYWGEMVVFCRDSSGVEQLFRKQQVVGSNPILGSTYLVIC